MANYKVLLSPFKSVFPKKWEQRQCHRGLIHFFEALSLYLRAGFALSYSWPETIKTLGPSLPEPLCAELSFRHHETGAEECVGDVLKRLKSGCRIASYRMWFGVLAELYDSGASLAQSVDAISSALRREQEVDLETHLRIVPLKANVVLMLFFLPPTFLCLFGPLVIEILGQFK